MAGTLPSGPSLIKLDVEGHEVPALQGMQGFISQRYPDIITESFSLEACQWITAMMSKLGYQYYLIDQSNRCLVERAELMPAAIESGSVNQLMTTQSMDQISGIPAIE
jgi:Methyltransferase FkbM domain